MQHWQDFVLAAGSLIFSLALIPSLRSTHKPAASTSLVTSGVLFIFAVTYLTLSLWFSAIAITINGLAWLVLALQKLAQNTSRSG